ncbi:MAG: alternative cytochrome c oxidase subunit 2 [Planctomycetaceae bacterium]|nr:MAG: alternative cytochrome c oxidase subunit 2 [Planctomycetaceae bacterium]
MAGRLWTIFFMLTAVAAVVMFIMAPSQGWWFPGDGQAHTTLGRKIDDLFYLILAITGVTFVGVQIALGYVLWRGAAAAQNPQARSLFTHGSHTLEVIWTIVPSGILLFIALYQMDVWAQYRVKSMFPRRLEPVAEVTARQFEWRIRYPALGKRLQPTPQPDDLYTVNDLRVPAGRPVSISLRTDDVQHSFFVPELRVKQDAVPGLVIPVWFEVTDRGTYDLVCAELCGWGHYKMKARVMAQSEQEFDAWKKELTAQQFDDGYRPPAE